MYIKANLGGLDHKSCPVLTRASRASSFLRGGRDVTAIAGETNNL